MRILLLICLSTVAVAEANDGLGISSWASWKPGQVTREQCPELRSVPLIVPWRRLEPQPGKYEFDQSFGKPLRAAAADDLHLFLMIWVGPASPTWVYSEGVPEVYTDREVNALGRKVSKEQNRFPHYLDPQYKKHFFGLIKAFGDYVRTLPPNLRERILFVQSCEGSTGDPAPYKGKPLDPAYAISDEVWIDFQKETWKAYREAVPGIPILVNPVIRSSNGEQLDWLLKNMNVIGLKQGMFSHGFHISGSISRLKDFRSLEAQARTLDKPVITRGEMDAELFVMGWSNRNVPQALYWSGLFATHCRLDVWNIPYKALKDEANLPAFIFFNRYAAVTDPTIASAAFCALRDGLDASDFERFPASKFGGKEGRKRDVERYVRIAEAFSERGARMDDPPKAVGGGMINRKRDGSNDVGWGILPGNYSRFLTQLDPGSSDVGCWNIDDTIYGRFARGFEHESGMTQMRFELDEAFQADTIVVNVTYLDRGQGAWSLGVLGSPEKELVRNSDCGQWKTVKIKMPRKRLRDAQLLLNYEGGDDTMFHLIEIRRS